MRPDHPIDPKKAPVYYGWLVLAAGTMGMLSAVPGSPPGVSPFVDPMIDAYGGMDRASFSLAYTLGTLFTGIVTFFVGEKLDRLDLRVVCIAVYAAFGLSLIGLGSFDTIYRSVIPESIQSDWIAWCFLFVGFFIARLTGMGLTMTLCRSMVARWFSERRGLAVTINGFILSLSFSGLPAVLFWFVDVVGWRQTWWILGGGLGVFLVLISYIFYRRSPEECGIAIENKENPGEGSGQMAGSESRFPVYKDFYPKEAAQTLMFWAIILGISLNGLYGTGVSFHLESICENAELAGSMAPKLLIGMGFINIFFTLFWGFVSHKTDLRIPLVALYVGMSLSVLGAMNIGEFWGQVLFCSGAGAAWGSFSILLNLPWPRYFGRTHLGGINGLVSATVIITSALGPYVFGLSEKLRSSYDASLVFCLIGIPLGLVLSFISKDPQARYRPES
ncbi:MAG: MFS transporter [Opitutales bacterium]